MSDDFLTPDQLAKRWRLHKKSLARWRAEKKGPPYMKLGGSKNAAIYYRMQDIMKWEKQHMVRFKNG